MDKLPCTFCGALILPATAHRNDGLCAKCAHSIRAEAGKQFVEEAQPPTHPHLVLCVDGPWMSRADVVQSVITLEPAGTYFFMGGLLAHPKGPDHVRADFIEGENANSVVLEFAGDLRSERERAVKFTRLLERLGAHAVSVESSGARHEMARWLELAESGESFDHYCAVCVLRGDQSAFYSRGMHLFGLPDVEVAASLDPGEAAELINRFNGWRLEKQPELESGETLSLTAESPRFRLFHEPDRRHRPGALFYNPAGVWRLHGA